VTTLSSGNKVRNKLFCLPYVTFVHLTQPVANFQQCF